MAEYIRKSTGMTLLRHLAVRKGRAKARRPDAIVEITVSDADAIISDFKEMKAERDEAMRLLGLRSIPVRSRFLRK